MINRGDIKLAIDMVVNAQDDNLFGGEAEYVINTLEDCGNTIAAQAAVIEKLREALSAAKYATKPSITLELIEAALAIPTDSTTLEAMIAEAKSDQSNFDNRLFMLERTRLIAAQAAAIERVMAVMKSAGNSLEWIKTHAATASPEVLEGYTRGAAMEVREALAIPTESAQILADVRRAERERVAQYVQQGTGDWMLGKKIAAAIRAME